MTFATNFKWDQPSRVDRRKARTKDEDAQWRQCCKDVDARDHRICRCCGHKTDPDAVGLERGHRHHIIYRSAQGPDASWNVITLCWECHDAEHVKRTLDVTGNADVGVTFWKKNPKSEWYVWRLELAPFQTERD